MEVSERNQGNLLYIIQPGGPFEALLFYRQGGSSLRRSRLKIILLYLHHNSVFTQNLELTHQRGSVIRSPAVCFGQVLMIVRFRSNKPCSILKLGTMRWLGHLPTHSCFYNKLTTQLALAICEKNKNRKIFRKGRCCWLKYEVPIWEKANLTFEEAAAYFGIGINRLRDLASNDYCPYVWWIGSKRLIKRRAFERYLETAFSVWFLYFAVENGAWIW